MQQRTITAATDTPTNADVDTLLIVDRSGAGDCTITLDPDANQSWTAGDALGIAAHDGDAIISPATGVTVDGSNASFTVAEGSELVVVNIDGVNEWASDDLKPSKLTADAPSTVTGTTDTLTASDYALTIRYTNASLVTVTIPTDASEDLPDGFWCALFAEGAGGVTVSTTGITLAGSSPNKTIAQNEVMTVIKTAAANTWMILGGTAA